MFGLSYNFNTLKWKVMVQNFIDFLQEILSFLTW